MVQVLKDNNIEPDSAFSIQSKLNSTVKRKDQKLDLEFPKISVLGFKLIKVEVSEESDSLGTNKAKFKAELSYFDRYNNTISRKVDLPYEGKHPIDMIKRKAKVFKVEISSDDSIENVVDKIKTELMNRRVVLPWVSMEFSQVIALWVLFVSGFLITTLIHSRVSAIYDDPDLALEEPWLVLDARFEVERVVSSLWLFILIVSPWVISGCIISTLIEERQAGNFPSNLPVDVTSLISIILLTMASGWQALGIFGMTVDLRAKRASLRSVPTPQ